jgi:pimeloyl-ACP methyl ester carboxylesterase
MSNALEQLIGVLNGAVGDYLARTRNGLATRMTLVHEGKPIPSTREALAAAHPAASRRAVLLVHGLMSTETVWRDTEGETYGSRLAKDLGFSALELRYNTGLRIAENGAELDAFLDALVAAWPVPLEELVLVGHSMGGLVIRAAAHAAKERGGHDGGRPPIPPGPAGGEWLRVVKRAFYLGTPHLGAPLERIGHALTSALGVIGDPYTQLVADIADLRSHGIKDLRHGTIALQSALHPVPLLPEIRHHLVAGTLTDSDALTLLFGDALVPLKSATFHAGDRDAPFSQRHVRVLSGRAHLTLAHDPEVYALIRGWCEEEL